MVYDGEPPPHPTAESGKILRTWNMLANGMGGLDWNGFELAAELFEVENIEALIDGLLFVKAYKPPKEPGTTG